MADRTAEFLTLKTGAEKAVDAKPADDLKNISEVKILGKFILDNVKFPLTSYEKERHYCFEIPAPEVLNQSPWVRYKVEYYKSVRETPIHCFEIINPASDSPLFKLYLSNDDSETKVFTGDIGPKSAWTPNQILGFLVGIGDYLLKTFPKE